MYCVKYASDPTRRIQYLLYCMQNMQYLWKILAAAGKPEVLRIIKSVTYYNYEFLENLTFWQPVSSRKRKSPEGTTASNAVYCMQYTSHSMLYALHPLFFENFGGCGRGRGVLRDY